VTPLEIIKPLSAASFWRHLMAFLLLQTCVTAPAADNAVSTFVQAEPPRVSSPIRTWRGATSAGLIQVELWYSGNRAEGGPVELVIRTSYGAMVTYTGVLVRVPFELKSDPPIDRLFIRQRIDVNDTFGFLAPIVAAIAKSGELRLYVLGREDFVPACVLLPSQ
jgi:hypothetical protein